MSCLTNNSDYDDDDDKEDTIIVKDTNLYRAYNALPETSLKLIQQAVDACLLSEYSYNWLCNTRLQYKCPKCIFTGRTYGFLCALVHIHARSTFHVLDA